jgi:cholesterol transport system auxiliary component
MRTRRATALLSLGLCLTACVSLVPKPAALGDVITLTPRITQPAAAQPAAQGGTAQPISISVMLPITAQQLSIVRVPVYDDSNAVTYLPGLRWVEPPAALVQNLLGETLTQSRKTLVLDPRLEVATAPELRLSSKLVAFGIDAPRHVVTIRLDVLLTRNSGKQVFTHSFTAQAPLERIDAAHAAGALNTAANDVAENVTHWVEDTAKP